MPRMRIEESEADDFQFFIQIGGRFRSGRGRKYRRRLWFLLQDFLLDLWLNAATGKSCSKDFRFESEAAGNAFSAKHGPTWFLGREAPIRS